MSSDFFDDFAGEVSKRRIFYLVWLGINKPELLEHVSEDSLTEVLAVLGSSDWRIKAYAMLVLGMVASRGVKLPRYLISEVTKLLSDPNEFVRSGAAWVLGWAGNSSNGVEDCRVVYDTLSQLLSDRSWVVRAAAVKSLSEIHKECGVLRDLVKDRLYGVLIGDKNSIVRRVAYDALKNLGE